MILSCREENQNCSGKRVNETQSHKIIVPLPPRYIVEKLQLGPLELSWDQVKIMLVCAILTTIVVGAGEGVSGLILNFIALLIIWGFYYKFARTHEVLVESKIIFAHKIRKLKGLDRYSSVTSPDKQVSELYRFNIKNLSKTGIFINANLSSRELVITLFVFESLNPTMSIIAKSKASSRSFLASSTDNSA